MMQTKTTELARRMLADGQFDRSLLFYLTDVFEEVKGKDLTWETVPDNFVDFMEKVAIGTQSLSMMLKDEQENAIK